MDNGSSRYLLVYNLQTSSFDIKNEDEKLLQNKRTCVLHAEVTTWAPEDPEDLRSYLFTRIIRVGDKMDT